MFLNSRGLAILFVVNQTLFLVLLNSFSNNGSHDVSSSASSLMTSLEQSDMGSTLLSSKSTSRRNFRSSRKFAAASDPRRRNLLAYGTEEQPFAQTVAEFKYHLMRHTQAQDERSRYTVEELELLAKASRMALDMFTAWRLSGRTGLNHAIGTASCMLHINAPSQYVILALMHNTYFAVWAEQVVGESSHPFWNDGNICARRRWVAEQLGDDMEFLLWRYYSMHSGRPEKKDPQLWEYLMYKHRDELEEMDMHIISFLMCDEIEQYHAYEQLWVDNDRDRSETFQADFLRAMDLLAVDPTMANQEFGMVRSYAEAMFKQTNELFGKDAEAAESSYETQFKNLLEHTFRHVSYAPFVNWAHLPQVNDYVTICRRKTMKCGRNFAKARNYWDTNCCDRGGPCSADRVDLDMTYDPEWLERVNLPVNRTLLPNKVQIRCHAGNDMCRGVKEGKAPMIALVDATKGVTMEERRARVDDVGGNGDDDDDDDGDT